MAKYKSRADRCADATATLNMAAEELREIAGDIVNSMESFSDTLDEEPTALDAETTKAILEIIERVGPQFDLVAEATGDIQALAEELGSWRDNMEGTNLETTSKYEEVSEAAGTLEDAASNLEGVSQPDVPKVGESGTMEIEDLQNYVEELEQAADDIENESGDAEGVSFPGAFGR